MRYMLLIHATEDYLANQTPEESAAIKSEYMTLVQELRENGTWIAGDPLELASTAKSVRVRNGERLVTDGPYAETKEYLAGYFMVDVPDVEAAVGIAARIPTAQRGTIEVRALSEAPT